MIKTKPHPTSLLPTAIRPDRTRGGRSSYDGCSPHGKPRPAPVQRKVKRPSMSAGEEEGSSKLGEISPLPEVELMSGKDDGKSHRQLVAILNHSNTHGQQVGRMQDLIFFFPPLCSVHVFFDSYEQYYIYSPVLWCMLL